MTRYRLKVYRRWFRKSLLVVEEGFRWPTGIPGIGGTVDWYPAQIEDVLRDDALSALLKRMELGRDDGR